MMQRNVTRPLQGLVLLLAGLGPFTWGAAPAAAGGANLQDRIETLGICERGATTCSDAVAAFTGQLVLSVDDNFEGTASCPTTPCPQTLPGTTTLSVTLHAIKQNGETFVVSEIFDEDKDPTTEDSPCCVPVCQEGDESPFLCSDPIEEVRRLTEDWIPGEDWLLYQIFPNVMRDAILENFPGVEGRPVIMRVDETSRIENIDNSLASQASFCVKVHIRQQ